MNRRKWISLTSGSLVAAGAVGYGFSDRKNLIRSDLSDSFQDSTALLPVERNILALAALAPSGHNTQPWFVKRMEPWHWIIGNDAARWLPAVDPTQRGTILSIGEFDLQQGRLCGFFVGNRSSHAKAFPQGEGEKHRSASDDPDSRRDH